MNINQCGCRPYGWLGLDGNRCIRVIPRQVVAIMDKEYILVLVTTGKNDSTKVWRVVVRYGGW